MAQQQQQLPAAPFLPQVEKPASQSTKTLVTGETPPPPPPPHYSTPSSALTAQKQQKKQGQMEAVEPFVAFRAAEELGKVEKDVVDQDEAMEVVVMASSKMQLAAANNTTDGVEGMTKLVEEANVGKNVVTNTKLAAGASSPMEMGDGKQKQQQIEHKLTTNMNGKKIEGEENGANEAEAKGQKLPEMMARRGEGGRGQGSAPPQFEFEGMAIYCGGGGRAILPPTTTIFGFGEGHNLASGPFGCNDNMEQRRRFGGMHKMLWLITIGYTLAALFAIGLTPCAEGYNMDRLYNNELREAQKLAMLRQFQSADELWRSTNKKSPEYTPPRLNKFAGNGARNCFFTPIQCMLQHDVNKLRRMVDPGDIGQVTR